MEMRTTYDSSCSANTNPMLSAAFWAKRDTTMQPLLARLDAMQAHMDRNSDRFDEIQAQTDRNSESIRRNTDSNRLNSEAIDAILKALARSSSATTTVTNIAAASDESATPLAKKNEDASLSRAEDEEQQ